QTATGLPTVACDAKWACIRICARGRGQVLTSCNVKMSLRRPGWTHCKLMQQKDLRSVMWQRHRPDGIGAAFVALPLNYHLEPQPHEPAENRRPDRRASQRCDRSGCCGRKSSG